MSKRDDFSSLKRKPKASLLWTDDEKKPRSLWTDDEKAANAPDSKCEIKLNGKKASPPEEKPKSTRDQSLRDADTSKKSVRPPKMTADYVMVNPDASTRSSARGKLLMSVRATSMAKDPGHYEIVKAPKAGMVIGDDPDAPPVSALAPASKLAPPPPKPVRKREKQYVDVALLKMRRNLRIAIVGTYLSGIFLISFLIGFLVTAAMQPPSD